MIPVILIHSGYQDYLNYSLNKALEKNEVYLIGDVNPNIQNDKFNFFGKIAKAGQKYFSNCFLIPINISCPSNP